MSSIRSASLVAGLIVLRCEKNEDKLTANKLQYLLYFVQKQFLLEDNMPCFKETMYIENQKVYIRSIRKRLEKLPEGVLSYSALKELFPIEKRMDPHSMAIMRRAIDAAARMSEENLLALMKTQVPYRKAIKTGIVSIDDLKKSVKHM